jgi:hypothetical protein
VSTHLAFPLQPQPADARSPVKEVATAETAVAPAGQRDLPGETQGLPLETQDPPNETRAHPNEVRDAPVLPAKKLVTPAWGRELSRPAAQRVAKEEPEQESAGPAR